MASHVEEIKERLRIEDVVSSYIKLEKSGANLKARCPFHNEKTPSFYVSPDRGTFYCFGCQAKGDIFTFVEKFEGLDFMGALKVLADKAGVSLKSVNAPKDNRKETLFEILEEATSFFESNLAQSDSSAAYVAGRGISKETVASFRIGFAPSEWRALRGHLKAKGYKDADVEAVGLIKKTDKPGGDPYYDTFRGRIMFPIADSSGRPIAFTGRTLDEDANPPKYLNSPETVLFQKSKVLFGLDKAKMDIRKRDYAILVEGQMDCVMLHQAGYNNTVAASGTAFVDNVDADSAFGLLTRLSDNIVVAFDSDAAGQKAVKRIVPAIALGMNVKIVDIKGGKDPADIIKNDPKEWKAMLEGKKDFVEYLVDLIAGVEQAPGAVAKLVRQDIFPFVLAMPQETPRYQAIRRVADRLMIGESALWKDFENFVRSQKAEARMPLTPQNAGAIHRNRLESIERKLLGLLHSSKHLKGDEARKKELWIVIGEEKGKEFEALTPEVIAEITLEAEITYEEGKGEKEFKLLLLHLEEEYLKRRLEAMMAELNKGEKGKDEGRARQAMADIHETTKRMQEIQRLSKDL